MKKRLLALALCLVMMASLLPLSAAAANVDRIHITGSGFGNTSTLPYYNLQNDSCHVTVDGTENAPGFNGNSLYLFQNVQCDMPVENDPVDGKTYYFQYSITASDNTISFSNLTINNCILTVNGYSTAYVKSESDPYYPTYLLITFQVTKNHNWQFTVSKNNDTLTGECQNTDCGKKVSVSLKADSVTLPNSPFNARLVGWEAFKQAVPSANYDPNSFDYKLNGEPVTDKSNPKAGNYQVGVRIDGLPGNVEYEGVVARANTNSAYLYTQYTAVDPAVTAQTGDNRPIELMMAGVVVFSALAAAAFIVDGKRKYQQ